VFDVYECFAMCRLEAGYPTLLHPLPISLGGGGGGRLFPML